MGIYVHNSIVVYALSLSDTGNTPECHHMISADAYGYVPSLHREGDLVC